MFDSSRIRSAPRVQADQHLSQNRRDGHDDPFRERGGHCTLNTRSPMRPEELDPMLKYQRRRPSSAAFPHGAQIPPRESHVDLARQPGEFHAPSPAHKLPQRGLDHALMRYEIVRYPWPSAEVRLLSRWYGETIWARGTGSTQDGQAALQTVGCAPEPLGGRPCDRPSCAASANPLVSCCPPASHSVVRRDAYEILRFGRTPSVYPGGKARGWTPHAPGTNSHHSGGVARVRPHAPPR